MTDSSHHPQSPISNTQYPIPNTPSPVLIVHGGAYDIPKETHEAHVAGCRRAAETGWAVLARGGPALEAVEAAVRVMEDDPTFDAGYGSFLNAAAEVELDAIIMDGRDLNFGAVGAVQRVRHPVTLARLVMTESEHAMLVGTGAEAFARAVGQPLCTPEELFDELVEAVPPGSMGLTLQPYWSPGPKSPGPEAKGAVIGFGDVHDRAHLYRAIIEGLAYALREGLERTRKRLRVHTTEVRVSGGGSQSDAAMQITADIFDLPASRPHIYETSGLGAAMDAAVGLGLYPDFPTAVTEMTRVSRTFEPRPNVRDIYDGLYHKVYRQMYRRLRPLYEEIRRITGYPTK